jgi:hypothetical protein
MSADGRTVIVCGYADISGSSMTPIIYKFNGATWDSGTPLTAYNIRYFGWSTAMSADGNTIIVNGLASTGMTPVVYRNSLFRNFVPETLIPPSQIEFLGYSTAMSADGNTVIVNGLRTSTQQNMTPIIYKYDPINRIWDAGTPLTANSINKFGQSTAMSADVIRSS